MSDSNIADVAISMFGNNTKTDKQSVYTYSGNIATHNGTKVPPGGHGLGIDCSQLVYQAQLGAGYNIPYRTTSQIYQDGKLTSDGAKHYDTVPVKDLKRGDLVLFSTHIGIIESFDPKTGKGQFYGSQTSTGPSLASFDINGGAYWGGNSQPILTGLSPKAQTYDPKAAFEVLQPIIKKRGQALALLQNSDPTKADNAQKTITNNQQVLDHLGSGRPGPANMQDAPQHAKDAQTVQPQNAAQLDKNNAQQGTQAFSTGDPDLDRLAAALFSGNEAAISQANARIEQSPQVQGMIQQGHDILAAQQREEHQQQEAMKQSQSPSLSR
jgi:hypothetical protein